MKYLMKQNDTKSHPKPRQTEKNPPFLTHPHLYPFLSFKLCLNWYNFIPREYKGDSPSSYSFSIFQEQRNLAAILQRITQKGNRPCLLSPPTSRQALYLPVYRHSRLNTLTNRGCFLSGASLSEGDRVWIYCLNNILHQYALSAMTERHYIT